MFMNINVMNQIYRTNSIIAYGKIVRNRKQIMNMLNNKHLLYNFAYELEIKLLLI